MNDSLHHPKIPDPDDRQPARRVVLIVDDDPDCRLLVRDALIDSAAALDDGGIDVFDVADGEAALRFLRRQAPFSTAPRPDLIYLDMEMPRADGLSALRQIKADPSLCAIPTVMFTGVADAAVIRRAAEIGANSYTVKPLDLDDLLRTVAASAEYWLGIHQSPHRRMSQAWCRR